MSKNRRRNKPNDRDKRPADTDRIHRPKVLREHVAHEFRDRQQIDEAESVTRNLLPHLRGRAQGLPDDAYQIPGWRSTHRRDILAKPQGA